MDGTLPTREEIRQASLRLPERQREALELRERERLSYQQIGAAMGIGPASVAQLISRARINLYDELRGTALASVAAPSAECERALPLIAAREDGQLDAASASEASWLDVHLAGCGRCSLAAEQMEEAAASYCASAPDATPAGMASGSSGSRWRPPRAALAIAFVALLLGGLVSVLVASGGAPPSARPAAEAAAAGPGSVKSPRGRKTARAGTSRRAPAPEKGKAKTKPAGAAAGQATAGEAVPTQAANPVPVADGGGAPREPAPGPNGSSDKAAVQPTRQTSTPESASKPKPAPTSTEASQPASEPAPAPAPTTEAPPPAEEPAEEPGHRGEPPGKPADRPPR